MTQDEKKFIKKYGELGEALLKEYGLENAKKAMEYHYKGEFYSKKDFAKNYLMDMADNLLPSDSLAHRILSNHGWCNWEHIAWELFVNDFKDIKVGNKTHAFEAF